MKRKLVFYLFLIFAVVLMIVLGWFFVFGYDAIQYFSHDKILSKVADLFNDKNDEGSTSGIGKENLSNEFIDDQVGSGGDSGNVNIVDGNGLECRSQEIQYSLKNFKEEVSCIEEVGGKCVNLVASCSVEVYNIDEADGVFVIEYSLVDSNNDELDSVSVGKNIVSDGYEFFSANFEITENVDEGSSCILEMENVPTVEVCN